MKEYKISYFYQSINDFGVPYEGNAVTNAKEGSKKLEFYKNARNGYSYAGEYVKTQSITEIK